MQSNIMSKIDVENFDFEVGQIRELIGEMDNIVAKSGVSGEQFSSEANKVMRHGTMRNKGMSNAEKQKLLTMEENQERIMANQKRISETLRGIKLDDIKFSLRNLESAVENKLNKDVFQNFQAEIQMEVNIFKKTLNELDQRMDTSKS